MKNKKNIFLRKKILIYGLGKSGISSYKFLKKKADVYLFDDNSKINKRSPGTSTMGDSLVFKTNESPGPWPNGMLDLQRSVDGEMNQGYSKANKQR